MRLRSVNLGIALTLSLAASAKAEDRPFMPPLDDLSYGAVMVGISIADAQPSAEDWAALRTAAKADERSFMPPLDDVSYGALLVALGNADALRSEDWSDLRTAAKAEDRPSTPPLDDLSYGAVMVGIAGAGALPSAEDWVAARADLEAATETTGALPTNPDRHFPMSAVPARDVPVPADAAEEIATEPFYSEALSILGLAEVEPLPLQAISSFDLTLTADPMPTAPAWDAI